jgi:small-conductance mechanosensitive channel
MAADLRSIGRLLVPLVGLTALVVPIAAAAAPEVAADESQLGALRDMLQPTRLLMVALAITAIVAIVKGLRSVAARVQGWFPDRRLLILQIATMFVFAAYIGGTTYIIFGILAPSNEALVAIGGALAVAVGLSLRDLTASLIAGVVLLFDRPFWVGDRITFRDVYGDVQQVSLRSTRIVTLDDNLVTIPNDRLLAEIVASGNAGLPDMMVVVPVHVALDVDLERAMAICREVAWTSRYISLHRPLAIVVSEQTFGAVLCHRLDVKGYVLSTHDEKAYATDLVVRIDEGFRRHGIPRPFALRAEATLDNGDG